MKASIISRKVSLQQEPDALEHLLTNAQVAELWNVSLSHVRNIQDRGELPYVMVGQCRRVRPSAALEYMADQGRHRD